MLLRDEIVHILSGSGGFFDSIMQSSDTAVRQKTSLIITQTDYCPVNPDSIIRAVNADPLRPFRRPELFNQPYANCHDFAWTFKDFLDREWRDTFLSDVTAGRAFANPRLPLAVGLLITGNHATNVCITKNAQGSPELWLIDTKNALRFSSLDPFAQRNLDDRRSINRFLNENANAQYSISLVYF